MVSCGVVVVDMEMSKNRWCRPDVSLLGRRDSYRSGKWKRGSLVRNENKTTPRWSINIKIYHFRS